MAISQTKKQTRRVVIALILVLALLGLIAAGVIASRRIVRAAYDGEVTLPDALQAKIDLAVDENAQEGTPNAAETAPSEEENFQVVINQMPTMDDGNSPCNIMAENPADNPYDLRVSLYLKSTGELLGTTHRIERGMRVEEIALNRCLPAGEYELIAQLDLFDDAQEPAGQFAVELSLLVRNEVDA